ncbi:MAG: methyl-accepting chemotaxis protein [Pseudomonadota bacterium]|nr:methyl-accepting chemotaxis protein [Pseudomonadota bacterium]
MTPQRKILIVDPKLQYRIMGMIIASGIGVCLVFLGAFFYVMTKIFDVLIQVDGLSPEEKMELFQSWNKMLNLMVVLVGSTLAGVWMWAHFFTNKIVGPIFNTIKKLDEYLAGDLSVRVHLRKKDYFQSLAVKINQVLDKVSEPNKSKS